MKNLVIVALFSLVMFVGAPLAKAAPLVFVAQLSGANEAPPTGSPGTGFATVTIDPVANTMRVQVSFQGLTSNSTAAHIHAATPTPFTGTAGVATLVPAFPGFPLGTTSGTYDGFLDMSDPGSYNPAFITANGGTASSAEAALFSAIMNGRSYLNIHTTNFGGGEIRGFLAAPVPEPTTMLLLGTGLVGIAAKLQKRRKTV